MARPATSGPPTVRTYLVGLALALGLTAVPFGVVAAHALPPAATVAVIAAAALLQVLVQLRWFLHLRLRSATPETVAVLALTAILVLLMFGGTLWIMFDANRRMDVGRAAAPHAVAAAPCAGGAAPASPSCEGSR